MATPEKKKPVASRGKKAATVAAAEKEKSEEKPQDLETEKPEKVKKTAESTETRKRPKAVKEVVAAKKPKSNICTTILNFSFTNLFSPFVVEIVVPIRQKRGTGVVLAMGQGDVGQLGLGPDILEKSRPSLVDKVKDIIDVVAGGMHTVCLTSKGLLLVKSMRK